MIKLHTNPYFRNPDAGDGGIRRVVEAQIKYLPEFGIQVVENPDEADVIMNHGASLTERPGIPMLAANHGLYWADYDWASWAHETNVKVIETMRRAQAITAPSRWVAHAITHGMLRRPQVIYHGVDIEDFEPDPKPAEWVLWNKARIDPVSSPEFLYRIAQRMPDIKFLATIEMRHEIAKQISALPNCLVIDPMSYEEMKKYVAKAGLYLCTSRETFGIGTLEAMACAVPVVGWAYGGQEEIIVQDETGYLVPFGDYDQLEKAIRHGLESRQRLGANARIDVKDRWQWPDKIAEYADIIKTTYDNRHLQRPKTTIVVTSYNLAKFLPDCLQSIQQSSTSDWECIVVDDCSTDNTKEIVKQFKQQDERIKYLATHNNLGLCGALNWGFAHANGKYIVNLDADNILVTDGLRVLSQELDQDSSIHIAYGHLDIMSEDGSNRRRNQNDRGVDLFPPVVYKWRAQMAHLNQIPSSAMMRREVLEESGGYRKRDWRNEDATFWCRATSFGFRAKKVTEASTFVYRMRGDSKSAQERQQYGDEGNWGAWFPWRLADSASEGMKLRVTDDSPVPRPDLVPFGAQGHPPKEWQRKRLFWPVRHLQQPAISVIIPVGPGHQKFLIDALDSLVAQDFPEWEVIVINDTGKKWDSIPGAPYAKVITGKGNSKGAGAARNVGAAIARGETLLFLDADDYLLPGAMIAMWNAYIANDRRVVVYGDWLAGTGKPDSDMQYLASFDFTCNANHDDVVLRRIIHPVSCLVPKWAHYQCGGFDEEMPVWEDWDYQIRLYGIIGLCGVRLEQALIVYRVHTGQRRRAASVKEAATGEDHVGEMAEWAKKYLLETHSDLYKGRKQLMCGDCPGKARRNAELAQMSTAEFKATMETEGSGMILKYHGPGISKISIKGPSSGKGYRVMNTPKGPLLFDVHPEDAKVLMARTRKNQPLYTELQPEPVATPVKIVTPPKQEMVERGIPGAPIQDWALPELNDPAEHPAERASVVMDKFNNQLEIVQLDDISKVTAKEAQELIKNADMPVLVAYQQSEKGRKPKPRKTVMAAINKKLSDA